METGGSTARVQLDRERIMEGTWMPVVALTVIIIGVVGGQLAQMVLKELLPLLRSIAEQRQQSVAPADSARIADALVALERRLERLEVAHDRLEEERRFTYELLAARQHPESRGPDQHSR
jgi:hypothetical protein